MNYSKIENVNEKIIKRDKKNLWDMCKTTNIEQMVSIVMPLLIEQLGNNGCIQYTGYFDIPAKITREAVFGKLDYQKMTLKIFDKNNNLLLITNMPQYSYIWNSEVKAVVVFYEDSKNE